MCFIAGVHRHLPFSETVKQRVGIVIDVQVQLFFLLLQVDNTHHRNIQEVSHTRIMKKVGRQIH
jgi:hypothetical protein